MLFIKYLSLIGVSLLIISCNEENPVSHEPLGDTSVGPPAQSLTEFESVLERVRTDLKIPGFSAAITKNRKIVWAKGFGYSNNIGRDEDVNHSVVAQEFLNAFVYGSAPLPDSPIH